MSSWASSLILSILWLLEAACESQGGFRLSQQAHVKLPTACNGLTT